MQPQVIRITDAGKFEGAGLPWRTVGQARWAYRQRNENGLDGGVFLKVGRSILINVAKFHAVVAANVA